MCFFALASFPGPVCIALKKKSVSFQLGYPEAAQLCQDPVPKGKSREPGDFSSSESIITGLFPLQTADGDTEIVLT